jgi:hypothetical protein
MALTLSAIQDFVNGTLNELGRFKVQQIAQSQTRYPMFGTLFGPERSQFASGNNIQRTLMNRTAGAAKMTGLYANDSIVFGDVTDLLVVPWRQMTTNWAFDEAEILHNKGEARIFDIMMPRREAAKLDLLELIESQAWQAPTSSTDTDNLFGIPYWVVKNATTGFNGGAPSGWTLVGNLNPSTTRNHKNYTFTYALTGGVSKTDLFPKLRTALRKTKFTEVTDLAGYRDMKKTLRLYLNEATLTAFETAVEAQNENLGNDLAPYDAASGKGIGGVSEYDGDLTFRRKPLIYTEALDSDTTNPLYFIDHSTLFAYVLKGFDMRETNVEKVAGKHTTYATHIDLRTNIVDVDRRRSGVCYGVV